MFTADASWGLPGSIPSEQKAQDWLTLLLPEAGQVRAAALQVRLTGNLQTSDPLAPTPQRPPGGPALLPGHQTETHVTAKPRGSIC